mgnify:CR=1 FL=1
MACINKEEKAARKAQLEMETKEEITGRVYLSGKMRGLTQRQYRAHFQKATNELIIKHHVHPSQIINPCYIARAVPCFEDDEYLELDFKILKRCHAIYMLNNWQDSEGAKAEKEKAKQQAK